MYYIIASIHVNDKCFTFEELLLKIWKTSGLFPLIADYFILNYDSCKKIAIFYSKNVCCFQRFNLFII